MKILIVNTYYAPEIIGGAELSVKKLAEGLAERGEEPAVLATGEQDSADNVNGITVYRFRPANACRAVRIDGKSSLVKFTRRMQDIWNRKNTSRISHVLDSFRPDVVHTNGLYDISPVIWALAGQRGIRVVHTLRDYYLRCPLVSYDCSYRDEPCRYPKLLCSYHAERNRKASGLVDFVTAPSRITLDTMLEQGYFSGKPHAVIPNAIDFRPEEVQDLLRWKNARRSDQRIFVYLGGLTEQKGIRWLLSAFRLTADHPEFRLLLAGRGPLEKEVRKAATEDGRIRYLGFLNEEAVGRVLDEGDVLLCPSLWNEPFGRVVLDAYKHAMPVISSDRGALPELVRDGITGDVVSAGNDGALAACMKAYAPDEKDDSLPWKRERAAAELNRYSVSSQVTMFLRDAYQKPGEGMG